MVTTTEEVIPSPLSSHGSKPNEVVHMDYLYMGRAADADLKYLLVLKDDFSPFPWLFTSVPATADTAAEAIASWTSTFGAMTWIVSDQGPHFVNQLIKEVTSTMLVNCLLYTSPSPRDQRGSRMPSSA